VIGPLPQVGIDPLKQALGFGSVCPPQVVGDFSKAGNPPGQIKMVRDFCYELFHVYTFSLSEYSLMILPQMG
jgi:hypothetical protein